MSRLDFLLDESINIFKEKYPKSLTDKYLLVSPSDQKMIYVSDKKIKISYSISTSKFGLGNLNDSFKTPTGLHAIVEKIGSEMPIFTIFKGRKPLGNNMTLTDLYDDKKAYDEHFENHEDVITSRILRLRGLEPSINLGGNVDSYDRYIYIHGTAHEDKIGQKASHGCIRMLNSDIIELFNICPINMHVLILDN
jgi:hypothetical protein